LPTWRYSFKPRNPERTVVASGRDLRISPKHAREVCAAIKGLRLEEAKSLLEEVIAGRKPIPFRRYRRKVGHRRELESWDSGRYPKRASKEILKVLNQLEANASQKDLDLERLKIVHAAAQKGMKIRKYISRAFGRSSPYFQQLTHIELAAEEV
jgi:large subunit ribosomal protein L22